MPPANNEGVQLGESSARVKIPSSGRNRSSMMQEVTKEAKELAEEFEEFANHPESFLTGSVVNDDASFLHIHDDSHAVEERYGKHSWQARTVHFLHSRTLQLIFSVLLMVDVAAVVVELFLEAHFPSCHFVVRDAVNCCPAVVEKVAAAANATITFRRLGGGHGHHDICAAGFAPFEGTPAGCDEHKWETVHMLHEVCFCITVAVLSTFLIELLILMYIEFTHFWHTPLYVLDLVIVVGTLTLEFFHRSEFVHAFDPAKLLILARCWRFIRIGHGLVMETHGHGEKEAKELKMKCKELHGKLKKLSVKLEQARSLQASTSAGTTALTLDSGSPADSPTKPKPAA